ncbi:hypothetical protein ANACOL_01021 [Anaerotruncus colihominis DSM 17241]|uniref:Uncharacterized protein n=1 Tax=Anaerotruncus colihominis DSM 17241 TaxID=445972 RepID=B0P8D2_9FIRM|nr:hypothetical protein ANACOL_01021 [Anaerotruncus colihominis DSM 17241]
MTRRYRRRERTGNEKAQDKNVLCFFVQADIALLPLSHTMENSLFFAVSVKQLLDTLGTDIPSFKVDDVRCTVTENACWFVLLQDDMAAININFQRILFVYVERAPKLDGKDNSAELVDLSDDAS